MKKSILFLLTFSLFILLSLTSCDKILKPDENNQNADNIADDFPREIKKILKSDPSVGLEFALDNSNSEYTLVSLGVCTDTDIVIPADYLGVPVTRIEANVFTGYTALTSIVIPNSVKEIPEYSFRDCSNLTNVVIGNAIKKIEKYTFYNCNNLKNVVLGNSVIEIEDNAFYNCSALEYINIPNSIQKIGTIFSSYRHLDFKKYEGGNYLGNASNPYLILISVDNKDLTTYKIHSNTKIIYPSVFKSCENLIAIDIPDSVQYIPDSLFASCKRLGGVTVGKNISFIGNAAFENCASLKEISIPKSVTEIGNYAFSSCVELKDISLPDNLISIGVEAFKSCNKLTVVVIPQHVATIGNGAFSSCTSLKNIIFDTRIDLNDIQDNTFYGCSSLVDITLPNSVVSIGKSAFQNCIKLDSINIPYKVTSIGDSAFENCYSLNIIYFNAHRMTDLSYYSDVFEKAGKNSTSFKILIGNNVTKIPAYLFGGCSNSYLRSIEFEKDSSCSNIGNRAFYNCDYISSIIIPKSVRTIGASAYVNCDSVKAVYYEGTEDEWSKISMVDHVNQQKVSLYFNADIYPLN